MSRAVVRYREFAPCEALREHVRAIFSFTPPVEDEPARRVRTREVVFGEGDSFYSPLFADGHVSMVFSFERECHADGVWRPSARGPSAEVIGAMTAVGPAPTTERAEMLGVYFRAAGARWFTQVAGCEIADRIVALEELWGARGTELTAELSEAEVEAERIGMLESALLRRMKGGRRPESAVSVAGLAAYVLRQRGRVTVESLAGAAGVSRQHLARVFREVVGVTPKTYCRLARFQAGLAYAGRGSVDWAQAAAELGYADQSHMIAEFRELSSLTPAALANGRWFHPFIERAR